MTRAKQPMWKWILSLIKQIIISFIKLYLWTGELCLKILQHFFKQ